MNTDKPEVAIETRERILNVAERLFAKHGLQGVSIRDITHEARANLGAINYHFGTKQQLIAAVFERRLAPIGEERLAALDAVEKATGGGASTLEAVLEAFILPAVRRALDEPQGTTQFRKLMGRCFHEPNAELDALLQGHFEPVARRFDAALSRAMPELSREDVFWRMHLTLGALHHSLMMLDRQPPGLPPIQWDVEGLVKRLVTFCAAGFRAPFPQ
jgi:AcrR family transcriptional regulator